jgi:AcrR family transcriptional regulator
MSHAGLTRGGFYRHFRGKTDLYAAVLESGRLELLSSITPDSAAIAVARALIDAQLSRENDERVDGAPPMVLLPSDVARADPAVRRAFKAAFLGMVEVFARCGSGEVLGRRGRDRALAVTAICVGSLVVSRAFRDGEFGDAVLAATRALALELCGLDERRRR